MHQAVRQPGKATQRGGLVQIARQHPDAGRTQGLGALRRAVERQHLHAPGDGLQAVHQTRPHIAAADDQQPVTAESRRQGAGTDTMHHGASPGNPAALGMAARALSEE